MTEEPATTPAADDNPWAIPDLTQAEKDDLMAALVEMREPDPTKTALTLRCEQLREQRDEARREVEQCRAGRELEQNGLRNAVTTILGLEAERDEARQERDEAFRLAARLRAEFANARAELAEARDRVLDLEQHRVELSEERNEAIRQRDAARAQAARLQAATTDADDLRARLEAMCVDADECPDYYLQGQVAATDLRDALDGAGTDPVSDSSASVDPSATSDPIGRNGTIQSDRQRAADWARHCGELIRERDNLRARVEAVVAPWPPGVRKGDVLRALDGGE